MKSYLTTRNSSRNLISNIISRTWTMIASLVFVPIYLKYLGKETYGLVTFFITLQSILSILGLGLSKTLRREFASGDDSLENRNKKYSILRSIEFVYILIGIIIVMICYFGATFLVTSWLSIGKLDQTEIISTIQLMGFSIAFQILANLYQGGMFGLEYQVLANTVQIFWTLLKNVGVTILLIFININVFYFFLWYVISDFLFVIVSRKLLIVLLNTKLKWKISDFYISRNVLRFSIGIMTVSIISTISTQVDKLIISNKLSLPELGSYNTAYTAASLTYVFASAISIVAFTRFTRDFSLKKLVPLRRNFIAINNSMATLVIAIGSFMCVFSEELILVWTQNKEITSLAMQSAEMQIIGAMFLALQVIPYEFALACGNTRINNIMGIGSVTLTLTLTPVLISNYGLKGAGLSYMITMILSMLFLQIFVNQKYINNQIFKWLFRKVVTSVLICTSTAFFLREILIYLGFNELFLILFAVVAGIMTLLFLLFIVNRDDTLIIKEELRK